MNVDVLLFVLWCASRGHRIEVSELDAADNASAPWHDLVVPIRQARRGVRLVPGGPYEDDEATVMQLKRHLLSAELEAERLQHQALEALALPPGVMDPAEAARSNLARFADRTGIPADAAPLAVLLRAAS